MVIEYYTDIDLVVNIGNGKLKLFENKHHKPWFLSFDILVSQFKILKIINENPNIEVIFCWCTESVPISKKFHCVSLNDIINNKIKCSNDGFKIRIPVNELPDQDISEKP